MHKLHAFLRPRLFLAFAIPLGIILFAALQATESTCTSTSSGSLTDPAIYGPLAGTEQNAECGVDLSLDYEVAPALTVDWDGSAGPLTGSLTVEGVFDLTGSAQFSGPVENSGLLRAGISALSGTGDNHTVTFNGGLVNSGQFNAGEITVRWQSTASLEGGSVDFSGTTLEVSGKVEHTGGTFSADNSTLSLGGDTIWLSAAPLSFSALALNGHSLLLGSSTSGLSITDLVYLENPGSQIVAGTASLDLSGGLTLAQGYLSASGGSLRLGAPGSVTGAGVLDLSDAALTLDGGLSIAGVLRINSGSVFLLSAHALDISTGTLELGGSVSLDGLTLGESTVLRLNADTTISAGAPLSVAAVKMQHHALRLGSATTDLTLSDKLTIDTSGEDGLDSGDADLTLLGGLELESGLLKSSGGVIQLGGPLSVVPLQSGMELADTILDLRNSLDFSSLLRITGNTSFQLNGYGFNLSGASIELGGNLVLDGVDTDNRTHLRLSADSTLTRNGPLTLGRLLPNGHTLTLGSVATDLTLLGIGIPEDGPSASPEASIELNPVIESISGERLADGSMKWSVLVSDDSDFSQLSSNWEYLLGANRDFAAPSYTNLTDPSRPQAGYGRIDAVMNGYEDADSGILRVTVCEQASNNQGTCAYGLEHSTSFSLELVPYAYQRPLICDGADCTVVETTVPSTTTSGTGTGTDNNTGAAASTQPVTMDGTILTQGADLGFIEPLTLSGVRIATGGGTLTLHEGGLLESGAEIDPGYGALGISRELENAGGTLTTLNATLRLESDSVFRSTTTEHFATLAADGWKLTLDGAASGIVFAEDVLLASGTQGGTGRIDSGEAGLTFNGALTLRDNASIHSSAGTIALNGAFSLEDGSLNILGGSMNMTHGSIGPAGTVNVRNGAQLTMLPDPVGAGPLTVSGTLDLDNAGLVLQADLLVPGTLKLSDADLNQGAFIFDLSGGRLEAGGTQVFDGTTDNSTTLALTAPTLLSRTDYGTMLLETIEFGGHDLGTDNMSLTLASNVLLSGNSLSVANGELKLLGALTLDNASAVIVDNGTLTLERGAILQDGDRLELNSGTLRLQESLALGGGQLSLDSMSQMKLTGDASVSADGSVLLPALRLEGHGFSLDGSVTALTLNDALNLDNGSSFTSAGGSLLFNDNLTLKPGSLFDANGGTLTLGGILDISGGELNMAGGILELQSGGGVSGSGALKINGTELRLLQPLNVSGTLGLDGSSALTLNGNALDLSTGSIESAGGTIGLDDLTISNQTVFALAADTELFSANDYTLSALALNGHALTLGAGSGGMNLAGPLSLETAGSVLNTGGADLGIAGTLVVADGAVQSGGGTLSLSGALDVGPSGRLTVIGGTLSMQSGGLVQTGGVLETSQGTVELSDNLSISGSWDPSGTTLRLLADAELNSAAPLTFSVLEMQGHELRLGSASTGLTVESAFILDNGTLFSQDADVVFQNSADIRGTLESSGGLLDFQQGGSVSGTADAGDSTFRLGGDLSVSGKLITNTATVFEPGTSFLDLSGGHLELGGSLSLDRVITDNQTRFVLSADTGVSRGSGFELGGLNMHGYDFNLGSAATDLTLHISGSGDNESWTGSADNTSTSTLISGTADVSFSGDMPVIGSGKALSSSGGTLIFPNGTSIAGGGMALQNSTLALGNSFTLAGGTLTLLNTDLDLLDPLTIAADSGLTFSEVRLNGNPLTLQTPTPSFAVQEQLALDHPDSRIERNGVILALNGGVRIDANSSLRWSSPGGFTSGDIVLNGGRLELGGTAPGAFVHAAALTLQAPSSVSLKSGSIFDYSGPAVSLGEQRLTLEGSGHFRNINPVSLDSSASELRLSGITLEHAAVTFTGRGLVVDNDSSITRLVLDASTPFAVADNRTLSGSIVINPGGTLQWTDNGTLAADLELNGGRIEALESLDFSGAWLQQGDAELNIPAGKTLQYSGSSLTPASFALLVTGDGELRFTDNAGAVDLTDPQGFLELRGGGYISRVRIGVSPNMGRGLQISGQPVLGELELLADTNLSVSNPFNVEQGISVEGVRLTLDDSGNFTSSLALDNGTLVITGAPVLTGALSMLNQSRIELNADTTLTTQQPFSVGDQSVSLAGPGTFNNEALFSLDNPLGELTLAGNVKILGELQFAGGKLKGAGDSDVSGNITLNGDGTIEIPASQTLSYQGLPVSLGVHTLTLEGGGRFANSNPILLVKGSALLLNGISLDNVSIQSASSDEGGVKSAGAGASSITELTLDAQSRIEVGAGHVLSVEQPLQTSADGLTLAGSGTLDLNGDLTLIGPVGLQAGDNLTLDTRGFDLNLSSDLDLSGGDLLTDNGTTINIYENLVLTTGNEQLIGEFVPIVAGKKLTLGSFLQAGVERRTILQIGSKLTVNTPDWPIQPTGQMELRGGVRLDPNGVMEIDGWLYGDIELNGGRLRVISDTVIDTAKIMLLSPSTLEIDEGKSLEYSGPAITVGANTFTLQGGGSLRLNDDDGNALLLDDGAGSLRVSGNSPMTVSHLRVNAPSGTPTLSLETDAHIGRLLHEGSSRMDLGGGNTLSIGEAFTVSSAQVMELAGDNGTLSLPDNMTLEGTLKVAVPGRLDNGTLILAGGSLEIGDSGLGMSVVYQLDSDLRIEGDSQIASNAEVRYSGKELTLGSNAFTLSGTGRLVNDDNLTLSDPSSLLTLSDGFALSRLRNSAAAAAGRGLIITGAGSSLDFLHLGSDLNVQGQDELAVDQLNIDSALTLSSTMDLNARELKLADASGLTLGTDNFILTVTEAFALENGQSLHNGGGRITFTGGLRLNGGSLLTAAGQSINGGIELNGGYISVVDNTSFSGGFTISADSRITVDESMWLSNSGPAISLGPYTLELEGGGQFANSGALLLDDPNSRLTLRGIALDNVSVTLDSAADAGILAEGSLNSSIQQLDLNAATRIKVGTSRSLSVEQPLDVPASGLTLAGTGVLDLNGDFTLNGPLGLTPGDNLTLDLRGIVLDLSDVLNLGGGTLLTDNTTTLRLSGTPGLTTGAEQTFGALTAVSPQMTLSLDANGETPDSTLRVISLVTVNTPSFAIEPMERVAFQEGVRLDSGGMMVIDGWKSGGIKLNGGALQVVQNTRIGVDEISLLASSHLEVMPAVRLALGQNLNIPEGMTLTWDGNGSGTLELEKTLMLAGTMKFNVPGTLDNGTVALAGGKLDAAAGASLTVESDIVVQQDSTIFTDAILDYRGAELLVGPSRLTLSGSGSFANTDDLTLDDPLGGLVLADGVQLANLLVSAAAQNGPGVRITGTGTALDNVSLHDNLTLDVLDSLPIGMLTIGADTIFSANQDLLVDSLAFGDNATLGLGPENILLRVSNQVALSGGQVLSNGGGRFQFDGGLTLNPGSLLIASGESIGGAIDLGGGRLDAESDTAFTGNLSISADSVISVSSGQTLSYAGAGVLLGANTLSLAGGGYFSNSEPLILDQPASLLKIDDIDLDRVSVQSAQTGTAGMLIQGSGSSFIEELLLNAQTRMEIDGPHTVSINQPLSVPVSGLNLAGTGALDFNGDLTLFGPLNLQPGDNLSLDVRGITLNLGADLDFSGGTLLTDSVNRLNLSSNLTLTTGGEQLIGEFVPAAPGLRLDLGNFIQDGVEWKTVLKIASKMTVNTPDWPIQPTDQMELLGGVRLDPNGVMAIDGWLAGDIELNGGRLEIEGDTTISDAAVTVLDSSALEISPQVSLVYAGNTIDIGDSVLSVQGGGSLELNADSGNALLLSSGSGGLRFLGDNATSVSHVRVNAAEGSALIEMQGNGVIGSLLHEHSSRMEFTAGKSLHVEQAFEVAPADSMEISGDNGTLLLGDSLTLRGALRFSGEGTLDNGTVFLDGGVLDTDDNATITADLEHLKSSTIDVVDQAVLKYTGNAINIGAGIMRFTGGGTFANTQPVRLDNPESVLHLDGITRISNADVIADLAGGAIRVDADSSIENLTHPGSSRMDISDGRRLRLALPFAVPELKTMTLTGGGGGTLELGGALTLSGAIRIESESTVEGGELALFGGALAVADNSSISSPLTHQADSVITVNQGITLDYSGPSLEIGALTLSLNGGGDFNNPQPLQLDAPGGILKLEGISLQNLEITADQTSGKIEVPLDSQLNKVIHNGDSRFVLGPRQTLALAGSNIIPAGNSMRISGGDNSSVLLEQTLSVSGILQLETPLSLSGGFLTLSDNGSLDVDADSLLSSALRVESDIVLDVAQGISLTYTGGQVDLGASALTLTGGGELRNSGHPLVLNDKAGVLTLNGIASVESVSIPTRQTEGRLEVFADATIKNLDHGGSGRLRLAEAKTLSVLQPFAVAQNETLEIFGAGGTLFLGAELTLNGSLLFSAPATLDNGTLILDGGALRAEDNATVSSDIQHQIGSSIEVGAGSILTYQGQTVNIGGGMLSLSGGGELRNSAPLKLDAADSILRLNGISLVERVESGPVPLVSGKLEVVENAIVRGFTQSAGTRIDIGSGRAISFSDNVTVPSGASMELLGGGGSLSIGDRLFLQGDLHFSAAGSLDNGTVVPSGGSFNVDRDTSISSAIEPQAEWAIDVADNTTLTLSQPVELGIHPLTLSGGGTLANSQPLILNEPVSVLRTTGIREIDQVRIGPSALTSGMLDVAADVRIRSLVHDNSSKISVQPGQSLTLAHGNTVPEGTTLEFTGAGKSSLALEGELLVDGTMKFDAGMSIDNASISGSAAAPAIALSGVLDVDSDLSVYPALYLQDDSSIDIAEGVTLAYHGPQIMMGGFRLSLGGNGVFANDAFLVLDHADSLVVFIGNMTIQRMKAAQSSNPGRGLRMESAGTLTELNLLADLNLEFSGDYDLEVSRLSVDADAKLSGSNQGHLKVYELVQGDETIFLLTLLDLEMTVDQGISVTIKDQIRLDGLATLNLKNGFFLDITGSLDLSGEVDGLINLNGGILCVTENTTFLGSLRHLIASSIYIAQGKILTYQGSDPLNVDALELTILGGGRFVSDNQSGNSIRLNHDDSQLTLIGDGTTVSHVGVEESVTRATFKTGSSWQQVCSTESNSETATVTIERLNNDGSSRLDLHPGTEMFLKQSLAVNEGKTMELLGAGNGTLRLGDRLSLAGTLQFSSEGTVYGGVLEMNGGVLDVDENAQISSAIHFEGNALWDIAPEKQLTITNHFSLGEKDYLTLGGSGGGTLILQGTLTHETGSVFELAAQAMTVEGGIHHYLEESSVSVKENSTFSSTRAIWQNNSHVDVVPDRTLQFDNSTLELEGVLSKTGEGGLNLDRLILLDNSSYSGSTDARIQNLELDNHSLSLESETGGLHISDNVTLDHAEEQILTNEADLTLAGALLLDNGTLSSTGGILTLESGGNMSGGKLDLSQTRLRLKNDFTKSGGSLETGQNTVLEALSDLSLETDEAVKFSSLLLNQYTLTLASETTDLQLASTLTLDQAGAKLDMGPADVELEDALVLSSGEVISGGGVLTLKNGGSLETSGKLDVTGGSLRLGGDFRITGGVLLTDELKLIDNASLTSDANVNLKLLELDNRTLTLGSETSSLTVLDNLTLDNDGEQIITQSADLRIVGLLFLDNGTITSSAGLLSLARGGRQSGDLIISGGILALGDNFTKTSGSLSLSNDATLRIDNDTGITLDAGLEVPVLDLNDSALTLGSETSDLTIVAPLILDQPSEKLISGDADLSFTGLLSVAEGELSSGSGRLTLEQGAVQSAGEIRIGNSTLILGGDLTRGGGTLESSTADLELRRSLTITSFEALSFNSLEAANRTLTLGSEISDLTLLQPLTLDDANEQILTGDADATFLGEVTLSAGQVHSSSGMLDFRDGLALGGEGAVSALNGVLGLGGDFIRDGGVLSFEGSILRLSADLNWNYGEALRIPVLDLNDYSMNLSTAESGLSIGNALVLDKPGEKLNSGLANLELEQALTISAGELTSGGGNISFFRGFTQSGGKVELSDSALIMGESGGTAVVLVKTGGELLSGTSALSLRQNLTMTSDALLAFKSLELGNNILTLGTSASGLSLRETLILDDPNEEIVINDGDLTLYGALEMSDGRITGSGGELRLSPTELSRFGGNAVLILENTLLGSADRDLGSATVLLDGEPNLSMTGGSIEDVNMNTSEDTTGTISTSGGVGCTRNCVGFNETGSYGLNTHGLYRSVISGNWKLTEADGERKHATMKVKLLSRPLDPVQVFLNSSDISEASLDQYELNFDADNWNRTRTILITGEDDVVVDGDIQVRITGYSDSDDPEYRSTGASKKHAFKYTFTNLNDDIQKGLSPIARIGEDQKINEGTRVILDGSASQDPDPVGRIVKYKWTRIGTADVTIDRQYESIAYFVAPQIDVDSQAIVFRLAVEDNDQTMGYATTTITVIDTKTEPPVVAGGIAPVLPKNLDIVADNNSDGSKTLKVSSTSGGSNETTLKADGSAVNSVTLSDGTKSEISVPKGATFNLNKDASTSIKFPLADNATLNSQVSATGEVMLGVSSGSQGINVKAAKGSTVEIGADGTSSISSPPLTNSDGSVTLITTLLNPDGSTVIELGSALASASASGAKSGSSTTTLSTDPGLSVTVDTSNGVSASTSTDNGSLATNIATDGTSATTFDNGSVTTTFDAKQSMDVSISSNKITSVSGASAGHDGVERSLTSEISDKGVSVQLDGLDESPSKIEASSGGTVTFTENRLVQSSYAPGPAFTSTATINDEGEIDTRITVVSTNAKIILPRVEQGATVTQESDKISINVPLSSYLTARNGARGTGRAARSASRFTSRSGVYSQYGVSGLWVGTDNATGKPVYVEPLSSDTTLLIENMYDNNSTVSLSSGSARVRIGDTYQQTLSSRTANAGGVSVTVSSVPAIVTLNGPRNLVSMPAYVSVKPADFETRFSAYKAVWVYRDSSWNFYSADSTRKASYLSKGYSELSDTIEAGEGFWVELNSPVNPTTLEVENRGSYRMLPQLSFTTDEWTLAGAAETINVDDIVKAANFDQTSEDDGNTIGRLNGPGHGGPPGTASWQVQPGPGAAQRALLLLAFGLLLGYVTHLWQRNRLPVRAGVLHVSAMQALLVAGLLAGIVACAPPQSDSSSNTIPYAGTHDRLHSIWKWDSAGSQWLAYSPKTAVARELTDEGYVSFTTISKGDGFWVRISNDGVPESLSLTEPPTF